MPGLRRTGTVGLAFTAYDVWRRMSPRQRRMVVGFARRYGPLIAAQAARSAKSAAARRKAR